MNIWFFNHYAVPPHFFPLSRPYNFAKHLIKSGYDVTIFAASTVHNSNQNLIRNNELYKVEIVDDIKYIYVKTCNYKGNGIARIKNMFEYSLRLFRVTGNLKKPDVILATSVHPLACVAGIKIANKYNCKCIVEIADMWPLTLVEMGKLKENSIITKLMYKLEHWIYKKSDNIVFTMEGGKDYIIDKGWNRDVDIDKVNYINNGIDLVDFKYNKENEIYVDKDLDDESTFKVLYTGSMGQANAVDYLIKSAEKIQCEGINNIKFILFGDGYQRQQLEDYVLKKKIKNVIFKYKVDKKYIPYILSKGNLNIILGQNINLYKYGLSPNKMFEYMASGKPIISNIKCGFDLLLKYNCGVTVKSGSPEELARGILKFYKLPKEEYEKYCNNAIKASKEFDFNELTKMLIDIIVK